MLEIMEEFSIWKVAMPPLQLVLQHSLTLIQVGLEVPSILRVLEVRLGL